MKKIIVSLTAASLIVASAAAADKGIDIVTTGQAAVYYQTQSNNGDNWKKLNTGALDGTDVTGDKDDNALFNQDQSKANVGVQLNLDADLKNDFTFGSQLTYIGTTGLEKNMVGGVVQDSAAAKATATGDLTDEIALTQIYVAKKIANTTVKLGRQELPMALSPLAFSEDWNLFKNTFEAALVVNSDIPQTTLVGAYVGKSNKHTDLANFSDLTLASTAGTAAITGTAYMLTAQNKSIPMTTVTASFYTMGDISLNATPAARYIDQNGQWQTDAATDATPLEGANAVWGDIAIADKSLPMGLSFGLQGGQINPESNILTDTTALGAKVAMKPVDALTLTAAYTTVSGEDANSASWKPQVAIKNVGTGVKTPLYTQMVLNQDAISLDANTIMLKAAYSLGDFGTVTAQGSFTEAGNSNANSYYNATSNKNEGNDFTDLELIYTVKAGGVDFLAAYVHTSYAEKTESLNVAAKTATSDADAFDTVRLWARYNF
jgi:hypothetical protein